MGLRWFRTSLNRADDFTAADPERPGGYCRVHRASSGDADQTWRWTTSNGARCLGEGYEATFEAAVARAEAAYESVSRNASAGRVAIAAQASCRPRSSLAIRAQQAARVLSRWPDGGAVGEDA